MDFSLYKQKKKPLSYTGETKVLSDHHPKFYLIMYLSNSILLNLWFGGNIYEISKYFKNFCYVNAWNFSWEFCEYSL